MLVTRARSDSAAEVILVFYSTLSALCTKFVSVSYSVLGMGYLCTINDILVEGTVTIINNLTARLPVNNIPLRNPAQYE